MISKGLCLQLRKATLHLKNGTDAKSERQLISLKKTEDLMVAYLFGSGRTPPYVCSRYRLHWIQFNID